MSKLMFDSIGRTTPRAAITVSQFEDEFYMDDNGSLKLYPEKRDCQAYIDSFKDTLFERILDMMIDLPEEVRVNPSSEYVDERLAYQSDLDLLLNADAALDEMREAYPELKKASREEVVMFLRERAKKSYEEYVKEKKESEVKQNNAKENEPQSESA